MSSETETAIRRSKNAAKTIQLLSSLPSSEGISPDLFRRAYAVAVIPDVAEISLIFQSSLKGYGVISSRIDTGWTRPAYYGFGGTKYKWKVGGKSFDVAMLFMNENAVSWFDKGLVKLKGIRTGVAGPIGDLTQDAKKKISGANVLIYAFVDGKLKGFGLDSDAVISVVLNPDNNINKALYGIKGREILNGKEPKISDVPSEVNAYKDILTEKFPSMADPKSEIP